MYACLRPLAILLNVLWIGTPGLAAAAPGQHTHQPESSPADLRARLTAREDENRVEQPRTIPFLGYPLSATLQYELALDGVRHFADHDPAYGKTRGRLEQQAEAEVFYTLGSRLSFLAQARVSMEQDLGADSHSGGSDVYVERGEMWLTSEFILGLPFSLEIGRLDFEDDRRWWWDDDLDAVRATVTGASVELALAVAQELGPTRSDRSFIEPASEGVLRVIAEASWDWTSDHTIQLFALLHADRSRTPQVDDIMDRQRADETDARLTWLGARATGAWTAKSASILAYWLDAARVSGHERAVDLMPLSEQQSVVTARTQRDVHGWAFDLGATWTGSSNFEPRLSLGYARGSGDKSDDDVRDTAFRQTGLNSNAPGFGGVQNFRGYGLLLDPELSNLSIVTAGLGVSLLTSSSLDLVYHHYRQVEPTNALRHARLEAALTGRDRSLGHGLDLVLAVEESDWLEFEVTASAFRAGEAFGPERNEWTYGGFAAIRLAF